MTDKNNRIQFISSEDFNEKASYISEDPYNEYLKFKKHFILNFKSSGPNSYTPTMAVFNSSKKFVGMVSCRSAEDKEDLFVSLAEMLYLPLSISSDLFILASDVRISKTELDLNESIDALTVSYVTPEHCLIYTSPYTFDDSNEVTFHEDKSFITKVSSEQDNSPVGNLIELFYIFSHTDTTGPFQPEEVLSYLTHAGHHYEIFHPENLKEKTFVAIPFKF
jgi:hypothetical protein